MGWVVQRNGAVYAEEYGFDASYEALVARIVADYVDSRDPEAEAAWIAEVDGAPAGFSLDRESRHHSFGQDLVSQDWSRPL
jgi:hypothetical protein